MSQHHYILEDGLVKYLGRVESEEMLQEELAKAKSWKRVMTESDLWCLESSIFKAYADAIATLPNQPLMEKSWATIARNTVTLLLERTSLPNLLHAIADHIHDDPDSDFTPYAHPAFYRGEAAAVNGIVDRFLAIFDGTDDGSGTLGHPGLEKLRRQLLALNKKDHEHPQGQELPS